MSSWIKNKIGKAAMKALGPVGELVEALLRPSGRSLAKDIQQEVDAAEYLLKELGYDVGKPGQSRSPGFTPVEAEPGTQFPTGRRNSNLPDEFPEYKPAVEGPILVESSNVHSIAYEFNLANSTQPGNLLVRFLGGTSKNRTGPGAMYSYKSVPYEIFKAFKIAASKGGFVWDELRVRGTVSGHQFDYQLADLGEMSHVPRQAGFKTGQTGEFYMPRNFRGQRSTLPEQQVRGPKGNLAGWERRGNLKFRAGGR